MAATTNATTMAILRFSARPSGVTKPTRANNNKTTGNSKAKPKANIKRIINDKYSLMRGSSSIGKAPAAPPISNDTKNPHAIGVTT